MMGSNYISEKREPANKPIECLVPGVCVHCRGSWSNQRPKIWTKYLYELMCLFAYCIRVEVIKASEYDMIMVSWQIKQLADCIHLKRKIC
jgi:hypothetical protein